MVRKFVRLRSFVCVSMGFIATLGAIIFIFPIGFSVQAQQQTPKPQQDSAQSKHGSKKTIWERIVSVFRRDLVPTGSRTPIGQLCILSPAVLETENVIWSDRPLFLWQGKVKSIEVRPYRLGIAFQEQPILWQFTPAPNNQWAIYAGEPLKPGQKYEWRVIDQDSSKHKLHVFQVMIESDRTLIQSELARRETQLQVSGVPDDEIALSRSDYFATKKLWSDALRVLYLENDLPATPMTEVQAITMKFCQPSAAAQTKL